jgi:hypothetical protein
MKIPAAYRRAADEVRRLLKVDPFYKRSDLAKHVGFSLAWAEEVARKMGCPDARGRQKGTRHPFFGKRHSAAARSKMSEKVQAAFSKSEMRQRLSEKAKQRVARQEGKKAIIEGGNATKERWSDPEYRVVHTELNRANATAYWKNRKAKSATLGEDKA